MKGGNSPLTLHAQLLGRAQQGDRQALEDFFAAHLPPLRRWARANVPRWLESQMNADDFVQVAALKTLIRLRYLSTEWDTIQPYLRATVRNLVRDEIRRRGRSPDLLPIDEAVDAVAIEESMMDRLTTRENWNTYQRVIGSLSARDRLAIVGRIQHGQSYEEVREALQLSTAGAARAATLRALRRLISLVCAETAPPDGCAQHR
jgi:RNA polymerase sigma factor (sigma-70 family)